MTSDNYWTLLFSEPERIQRYTDHELEQLALRGRYGQHAFVAFSADFAVIANLRLRHPMIFFGLEPTEQRLWRFGDADDPFKLDNVGVGH